MRWFYSENVQERKHTTSRIQLLFACLVSRSLLFPRFKFLRGEKARFPVTNAAFLSCKRIQNVSGRAAPTRAAHSRAGSHAGTAAVHAGNENE